MWRKYYSKTEISSMAVTFVIIQVGTLSSRSVALQFDRDFESPSYECRHNLKYWGINPFSTRQSVTSQARFEPALLLCKQRDLHLRRHGGSRKRMAVTTQSWILSRLFGADRNVRLSFQSTGKGVQHIPKRYARWFPQDDMDWRLGNSTRSRQQSKPDH
jgi:hypothetical protein